MNGDNRNGLSSFIRVFTLFVSNAIKLSGLVIAVHAGLSKVQPEPIVLALSAFMMAGAQVSEEAILKGVQRMFQSEPKDNIEEH